MNLNGAGWDEEKSKINKKKQWVGRGERRGRRRGEEETKEKNSKQMGRKVKLAGGNREEREREWWQLMLAEITKGRTEGWLYVCWLYVCWLLFGEGKEKKNKGGADLQSPLL